MKRLGVFLIALALVGCAPYKTLDELEDEAMLTGDYSALEARERSLARRAAERGSICGADQVSVCRDRVGRKACGCVARDELRTALGAF